MNINTITRRLPKLIAATAVCLIVSFSGHIHGGAQTVGTGRLQAPTAAAAASAEVARLQADLIEKTKQSRATAEKLLALHEQGLSKLADDHQRRRALYDQGLISRLELEQSEQALAASIARVEEDKRWIRQSDIAISEAWFRDELMRLPALPRGAYSETGNIVRYSGVGAWSLTEAQKIEGFFSRTFGQRLPVSAFGQTPTHDRLRFDHRNAIDVALHPDSDQGKSLQAFLREAGIPFIAFRHAAPGSSTGAHIHIGHPSVRK